MKICLYSDSLNVNGYVVGEIKEMAAITIVTMSISIMCLAYTLAMRGAGRGRTTTTSFRFRKRSARNAQVLVDNYKCQRVNAYGPRP